MKFDFNVDAGIITATDDLGNVREARLHDKLAAKKTHEIALAIMTANTIEGDMSHEAKAERLNFFMWSVFSMYEN